MCGGGGGGGGLIVSRIRKYIIYPRATTIFELQHNKVECAPHKDLDQSDQSLLALNP